MTAAAGRLRMVFAGGGTGGHLYPAVAVAQELRRRRPDSGVLFINAGRPLEREVLARQGFTARSISVEGLKGRGRIDQLAAAAKLPLALARRGCGRRFPGAA